MIPLAKYLPIEWFFVTLLGLLGIVCFIELIKELFGHHTSGGSSSDTGF